MDTKVTCCNTCGVMCGLLCRKLWGCCCCGAKYLMVNQDRSGNIEDCVQLIVDGKVKPMVDEESPFRLEDYQQCFAKCAARKAHGKLLLKMWDDEEVVDKSKGDQDDEKY